MFVGLLCLVTSGWAQTSEVGHFRAHLSPSAELPLVTDAEAVGTAHIAMHINRDAAGAIASAIVDFDIDFYLGQDEELVALHIHRGSAGATGPIVISSGGLDFSTPSVAATAGEGRVWRQRIATADTTALEAIEGVIANPAGYYVNMHSSSHRPGLLRGQLENVEGTSLSALQDVLSRVSTQVDRALRRLGVIP